jgi:molybdopterin synthase catalytic subunit
MSDTRPSIDAWLDDIMGQPNSDEVGIALLHYGVVRGSTREGAAVARMEVTRDDRLLREAVAEAEESPGVNAVRVWVNEGTLEVGEVLMCALVAGDTRPHALSAWERLAGRVKTEVMDHKDVLA